MCLLPPALTCAHDSGIKVALLPVAAARASSVLLQPGGPCSSTPRGGDRPSRRNASAHNPAAHLHRQQPLAHQQHAGHACTTQTPRALRRAQQLPTCVPQRPLDRLLQALLHVRVAADLLPGDRRHIHSGAAHDGRTHALQRRRKVLAAQHAWLSCRRLRSSCCSRHAICSTRRGRRHANERHRRHAQRCRPVCPGSTTCLVRAQRRRQSKRHALPLRAPTLPGQRQSSRGSWPPATPGQHHRSAPAPGSAACAQHACTPT